VSDWSSTGGQWSLSGTDIHNSNTGNVGIGLTAGDDPTQKLHVVGRIKAEGGDFFTLNSTGNATSFGTLVGNDANYRMTILSSGKIWFGPGGGTAAAPNQDTNLYRSAVSTLKTDNNFVAGGVTNTEGGLIIETRTGDPASPENGRMWLRTDL